VKGIVSSFVWPTPSTMMLGPFLLPIALRVGLPVIGVAMAMNLFGHGIALSGDFIIQGAPKLTSSAAGVTVGQVMRASVPLVITAGVIATGLGYWMLRRDMKRGKLTSVPQGGEVTQDKEVKLSAKIAAILVPLVFLATIVATITLGLKGDDATALIGGVSFLLFIVIAFLEYRHQAHQVVMTYVQEGFTFSMKIFAPVIPIAGFFFMGSPDVAPQILGKGAPGYLFDLGKALAAHVPLSMATVAIIIVLVGIIAGLDGSGFSGLVLVGTLAQALGTPVGANVAMLAALGQLGSIYSGGGTLVPWGVLDVAGVTGVNPEELTRRNFLPVMAGLAGATVVAIVLM
jgi:hypothetical protein